MLEFAAGVLMNIEFCNIKEYEEYLRKTFPQLAFDREYNI